MKNRNRIILIIIILLGAVLRLCNLGGLPESLHNDEVMNRYVGRFALQNGVDLYGKRFPWLYFNNFGDYPNILPMYLSGLFTYIFGINTLAIRFPIALSGVISIGLIYLVAREIFPKSHIPLFSALVVAISPWQIVMSRSTAEAVTATTVYLLGLWALLMALKRERWIWFGLVCISFVLTYLLYPSFRVFIPLSLIPVLFMTKRPWLKWMILGTVVVFVTVTIFISQTVWGQGRLKQTSVLTFNEVVPIRVMQLIYGDTGVPMVITRAFHNKYHVAYREVINQYLTYFSGSFLFVRGGLPARYQLTDQGLFYISYLAFLIVAIILLILGKSPRDISKKKLIVYYLYVLAISALPAALTLEDAPNVHRAYLTGTLMTVVFAWGINEVWVSNFKGRKVILSLLIIGLIWEFLYFGHQYVTHSKSTQAFARNSEVAPLVKYINKNQNKYQVIVVPAQNQLALHYLWANRRFEKILARSFEENIYTENIDNLWFTRDSCASASPLLIKGDKNMLIIDRAECPEATNFKFLTDINYTDGLRAYRVYESN